MSALAGVSVVLSFLFFSTHLLVYLYTGTVVGGVATDAVRVATGSDVVDRDGRPDPVLLRDIEGDVRRSLGAAGADARVDWQRVGGDLVLHVSVDAPSILPSRLATAVGLATIDRSGRMRIERWH